MAAMTGRHRGGRVIVVGSVNADLVVTVARLPAPGETVTGGRFARHGGGKGANQAVAAARMGAGVALVVAVGADELGDRAIAELRDEHIDVSAVARRDDQPTGVALIVVDRVTGENQIAVASGANAGLGADDVERALERLLGLQRGVILVGHEVSEEAASAAGRAAQASGWTLVVNPAPARPLAEDLLGAGPILTPNAAEAHELTGCADPEAAATALAALSGAPVLVTLGRHGALLLEPATAAERLPAHAVPVVDTTGAGDAVNGALAAELARGEPVRAAARTALAAAALAVQEPGARAGLAHRQRVLDLLRGAADGTATRVHGATSSWSSAADRTVGGGAV